ncbi:DNA-directed RNA polymerase I subunit rpa1 [Astathelohania contejeani]|uniref:DNA-directed RNA polymerase subunit n=1 Tax=Astathelohania contejeani TaxID=164912 RepID=A0ABQ7I1F2_9MICR|nr:DNA-directed RNA polymerase I subunit rpa1 [Thelohania contejeani]
MVDFYPSKLNFTFYTNEEIRKLSIVEIKNPATLDSFEHPIPHGLHDSKMGPLNSEIPCHTCGLIGFDCPGHFGHIELKYPVLNPLLASITLSILKGCCLECFRFRSTKLNEDIENMQRSPAENHHTLAKEIIKACASSQKCPFCKTKTIRIIKGQGLRISRDKAGEYVYFEPKEIREVLRKCSINHPKFFSVIFGEANPEKFFMDCVVVLPNKFRPNNYVNGKRQGNPQNILLARIIQINNELKENDNINDSNASDMDNKEKWFANKYSELQSTVLTYFDSEGLKAFGSNPPLGKKQILEKKEGLFRCNIMGKRVNYSARSVISPDPNIETREIGIPLVFATRLTFPESVTNFNVDMLRRAVINGSNHPGASFIEEDGIVLNLSKISEEKRATIANSLLVGRKKVWRHLRNGDVVLVNRQPTLHKPSMMAHRVRVLPQEKTLRLHYTNCGSYNADFDGDEMNIHVPQNHLARAECMELGMTDHNYTVATNGRPIRGLVQDHVVMGAWLTLKDTFIGKSEYESFVCAGLSMHNKRIVLDPPTITRPAILYTGKQVISTILKNMNMKLTITSKTKIQKELWHPEESILKIVQGDIMTGILDKNQLGASAKGLVHAAGELYGTHVCNDLLTVIGRVLNRVLITSGFTIRMDDLLLTIKADKQREDITNNGIEKAINIYKEYISKNPLYFTESSCTQELDSLVKGSVNDITSEILRATLPIGQLKPFPYNNIALAVITGAKGSLVNLSQISGLLGQQELEGHRVPIMVSGRTLPCFEYCDPHPRAGGYITQRFLSGIKAPEYYFHCMAGREGLIDTAVKTARSGYLQRCLIKHLEGVKVEYDLSVRNCGKVVQFIYGEDGIDCTKTGYIGDKKFLKENYACIKKNKSLYNHDDSEIIMGSYLIEPGEPVGIISAQSIGEPSTQMTLNTFHLAGVGSQNVTLGIPRLREIIMVASKNISTPIIRVPMINGYNRDLEETLKNNIKRVTLKDCVKRIVLKEEIINSNMKRMKRYRIELYVNNTELDYKNALKELKKLVCKKIRKCNNVLEIEVEENNTLKAEEIDECEISNSSNSREIDEEERYNKDNEPINMDGGVKEEFVDDFTVNERVDNKDDGYDEINDNVDMDISMDKLIITLFYPVNFMVYLLPIIENVIPLITVKEIKGIRNISFNKGSMIIEGNSFSILSSSDIFDGLLDLTQSYSNDIYAVYATFGIEAARNVIVKEIASVFDVYGIAVDHRHLLLVADYMTMKGEYLAFSRHTLDETDSPLQRMSYEGCYGVLKEVCVFGESDDLSNPSACITAGMPIKCGTGSFDIKYKLT